MHSKHITKAEREHMRKVKETSCAVCDAPPPSQAHHITQGSHWTTIGLCASCHVDNRMGWHGGRIMWKLAKLDELAALNITLSRVYT
jgi:hypothetical protein